MDRLSEPWTELYEGKLIETASKTPDRLWRFPNTNTKGIFSKISWALVNMKLSSAEQDGVSKLYSFHFPNTLHILFDDGILLRLCTAGGHETVHIAVTL
jgi:hypothetical protein